MTGSSRLFFIEDGEAGILRRALEASPNTRFCGSIVAAGAIATVCWIKGLVMVVESQRDENKVEQQMFE